MRVTGFRCVGPDGQVILCDAFGNNVALACPNCGHPLLITVLPNGRGSDKEHRAKCGGCGRETWVDVKAEDNSIWITWSN